MKRTFSKVKTKTKFNFINYVATLCAVYTSYDVYISIVANIIHNPAKEGSLRRISFWIMYLTTREVQLVYCWFATFKKVQCSCTTSIDDSFFAVLRFLYKLQTWNCSARSANQNNNNFTVASCIRHVNQQRIIIFF